MRKVGIPFGKQLYPGFSEQSFGASYVGTSANTQILRDNTFNYYDNLTWQRGRHLLSFGVQATRYQQNYLNASNYGFLGEFDYSGIFTSNPNVTSGRGRIWPGGFHSGSGCGEQAGIDHRYRRQPAMAHRRIRPG